jgi:hypothetical protein
MRALPLAIVLLAGCGSATPVEVARRSLEVSAEASHVADKALAKEYLRRAHEALTSSESFDAWEARMEDMNTAVDAMAALRETLFAAEIAVDVWERTGNGAKWLEVVGCIGEGLLRVQRMLLAVGVSVPGPLQDALELLGEQGARLCGKGLE